jgi:hypothetical protein
MVVLNLKHYRGPVWDEDNPTPVRSVPIQWQCGPVCCTRKKIPLQITWATKNHSLQGHNAGPTAKDQTPNAIQRIVIHLGERRCETLNPGLIHVAVSRATTSGYLGHMTSIQRKCMNIKQLTHSYSTGDEYVKVKQ